MSRTPKPLEDRFWASVDKRSPGECWMWTGCQNGKGYGVIGAGGRGGRHLLAPRLSYETHIGPIPTGLHVCHSCDNPSCVNPAHLWLGTPGDNARDRDAKGRVQHGERHYNAKLTAEDVAEIIKQSGIRTQTELARKFGVDPSNISHILSGKRWKRLQALCGREAALSRN